MDHNALRCLHATMCNAQCNNSEDNFFELGVNTVLKDKDSLIEKIFCTNNEHALFYLLSFINFSQNENRHPKIVK